MAYAQDHSVDRFGLTNQEDTSVAAQFTVDLEWPEHALLRPTHWPKYNDEANQATYQLLARLKEYRISAIFYVLGEVAYRCPELIKLIQRENHQIGSHGFWHRHGERQGDRSDWLARQYLPLCVLYRSPYWDTTPRPGLIGGAHFRLLPYWLMKREVVRTGMFAVHPHDFFPQATGPLRRRFGTRTAWNRLDRLLTEVPFV